MSKISAKQRYEQLTEWLEVRKQRQVKTGKIKRESRLEYYQKRNA